MSLSPAHRRAVNFQNLAALAYAAAFEQLQAGHVNMAAFMQSRARALAESGQKMVFFARTALEVDTEPEEYVPHGYAPPTFIRPKGRLIAPQWLPPKEHLLEVAVTHHPAAGELRSAKWDSAAYIWHVRSQQMRCEPLNGDPAYYPTRTKRNNAMWCILSQPGPLNGRAFKIVEEGPAQLVRHDGEFIDPPSTMGWVGQQQSLEEMRRTHRMAQHVIASRTYEDAYGRERYSDDSSPVSGSDGKGR